MNYKIEAIIKKNNLKLILIIAALIIILFLIILFSTCMGSTDISIKTIIKIIFGKIFNKENMLSEIKPSYQAIIWNIRLPRILSAVIIGAGLAVSGAVLQSLLMNPLADSYTIGVSSGAAFSAVLIIYLNILLIKFTLPIIPFAFIGAIGTLLLVIALSSIKGILNSVNLIIAGIIVSSIFSAGISLIKSISGESVSAIIFWLMGSLSAKNWHHVILGYSIITLCIIICFYYSHDLNIISFGEKEAGNLGINAKRVSLILLIFTSIITAVCVSISGIIGFIGLIVPHILRFIIGSDNRKLLPLTALLGAILLVSADTLARSLMNLEIPVGVITTLLGGPFFIYIFITKNKNLY